jgi:hypothetical protein
MNHKAILLTLLAGCFTLGTALADSGVHTLPYRNILVMTPAAPQKTLSLDALSTEMTKRLSTLITQPNSDHVAKYLQIEQRWAMAAEQVSRSQWDAIVAHPAVYHQLTSSNTSAQPFAMVTVLPVTMGTAKGKSDDGSNQRIRKLLQSIQNEEAHLFPEDLNTQPESDDVP